MDKVNKVNKVTITKDDDFSLTAILVNHGTNIKIVSKYYELPSHIETNSIYVTKEEAKALAIALLQLTTEDK